MEFIVAGAVKPPFLVMSGGSVQQMLKSRMRFEITETQIARPCKLVRLQWPFGLQVWNPTQSEPDRGSSHG
jgi:hypothetical protein